MEFGLGNALLSIVGFGYLVFREKVKPLGNFSGMIFLLSSALFLISFLSMFVEASSLQTFLDLPFKFHAYLPVFLQEYFATLSGVSDLGAPFRKWSRRLI